MCGVVIYCDVLNCINVLAFCSLERQKACRFVRSNGRIGPCYAVLERVHELSTLKLISGIALVTVLLTSKAR